MKTYCRKTVLVRIIVTATFLGMLSIAYGQTTKLASQKKSNTIKVYTTAQNTSFKLTPVENIEFTDPGAMVERKVFIFFR